MNPHYPVVSERAAHRCEYCRAPEAIFNLPFEVEHIIPSSRGGSDDPGNLALACRACTLFKAARAGGIDEPSQTEVRLFHPRKDVWEEHFAVEEATGGIQGLSAVGRLTVEALQMNRPVQRTARLHWMKLEIFP